MTKEQFEEQLKMARTKHKELASLYWCGFARGLQRAFLGNRFSKNTDHFAWLDFACDPDQCVAELGRGYRDGLRTVVSYGMPENSARK